MSKTFFLKFDLKNEIFIFSYLGLQTESDCSPCLGGYYCPIPGMVTPIDLCDAGYFCSQYANISAPDQGNALDFYLFILFYKKYKRNV